MLSQVMLTSVGFLIDVGLSAGTGNYSKIWGLAYLQSDAFLGGSWFEGSEQMNPEPWPTKSLSESCVCWSFQGK